MLQKHLTINSKPNSETCFWFGPTAAIIRLLNQSVVVKDNVHTCIKAYMKKKIPNVFLI